MKLHTFPKTTKGGIPHGFPQFPLQTALQHNWSDDQLFVPYSWPSRVVKSDIPDELRCFLCAVDFDADAETKKTCKETETPLWPDAWVGGDWNPTMLSWIPAGWCALFATPSGIRAIYAFTRELTPREYEGFTKAFVAHINQAPDMTLNVGRQVTFQADDAVFDFTRGQRLPKVQRSVGFGKDTRLEYRHLSTYPALASWIFADEQARIDVDSPGFDWRPSESVHSSAGQAPRRSDMPGPQPSKKHERLAKLIRDKAATRWQKYAEAVELQIGSLLVERDNFANVATGMIANLARKDGFTLRETWYCIGELVLDSVAGDPSHEHLHARAWDCLANYWESDQEKDDRVNDEYKERMSKIEAKLDLSAAPKLEPVVAASATAPAAPPQPPQPGQLNMQGWKYYNRVPEHWDDLEIRQHALLCVGAGRAILRADGSYFVDETKSDGLGGMVVAMLGKNEIIRTHGFKKVADPVTGDKELKEVQLDLRSMKPEDDIGLRSGASFKSEHTTLVWDGKDRDGYDFTRGFLAEPVQRLPGLNPHVNARFDSDIQQYFSLFFGNDTPQVTAWLSLVLACDTLSLPALLVQGPSAIGKSYFVEAIGACFYKDGKSARPANIGSLATGEDATFQEEFLQSPILHVVDKTPTLKQAKALAEYLKSHNTELVKSINAKYRSLQLSYCYHRTVLSTNDGQAYDKFLSAGGGAGTSGSDGLKNRLLFTTISEAGFLFATEQGWVKDSTGEFVRRFREHVYWLNTPEGRQYARDLGADMHTEGNRALIANNLETEASAEQHIADEHLDMLPLVVNAIAAELREGESSLEDFKSEPKSMVEQGMFFCIEPSAKLRKDARCSHMIATKTGHLSKLRHFGSRSDARRFFGAFGFRCQKQQRFRLAPRGEASGEELKGMVQILDMRRILAHAEDAGSSATDIEMIERVLGIHA